MASVILLYVAASAWRDAQSALRAMEREAVAPATSAPARPQTPNPASQLRRLIATLPESSPVELIVQRLDDAARRADVALLAARSDGISSASADTLSRGSLSFTLRGRYPAVKATLAELLTRTHNATLLTLSLRRTASASEVEAQVVLNLWARPSDLLAAR